MDKHKVADLYSNYIYTAYLLRPAKNQTPIQNEILVTSSNII